MNSLNEFIGQDSAVSILKDMVCSAKYRKTAIAHCLIVGKPGLGKTTIAQIMAREMGAKCHVKMAQNFKKPEELLAYIAFMRPKDVLLLDEVHAMKKEVQEGLFHYMENRQIDIKLPYHELRNKLQFKNIKKNQLVTITGRGPDITIVGATTNPEHLLSPFIDRFQSTIELAPYNLDAICEIIQQNCEKTNIRISPEATRNIAKRCKGTPRICLNLIKLCRDYLIANETESELNAHIVECVMLKHEIDNYGLKEKERIYLKIIKNHGPIGLSSIAKMMGYRKTSIIEEMIEPYIIGQQWVTIDRGRKLTELGKKVLVDIEKWENIYPQSH